MSHRYGGRAVGHRVRRLSRIHSSQQQDLVISDGEGNTLVFHTACSGVRWVALSCRHLLNNDVVPGASALEVRVCGEVYRIRRYAEGAAGPEIEIAHLSYPDQHVWLTRESTMQLADLLDGAVAQRFEGPPQREV